MWSFKVQYTYENSTYTDRQGHPGKGVRPQNYPMQKIDTSLYSKDAEQERRKYIKPPES